MLFCYSFYWLRGENYEEIRVWSIRLLRRLSLLSSHFMGVKNQLMTPKHIKKIRTALELTQEQFGAMLKKSPSAVKRWESGKHRMDETTNTLLTLLMKGGKGFSRKRK